MSSRAARDQQDRLEAEPLEMEPIRTQQLQILDQDGRPIGTPSQPMLQALAALGLTQAGLPTGPVVHEPQAVADRRLAHRVALWAWRADQRTEVLQLWRMGVLAVPAGPDGAVDRVDLSAWAQILEDPDLPGPAELLEQTQQVQAQQVASLARLHPVAARMLELGRASSQRAELDRLHTAARYLPGEAEDAWAYPWEMVDAPALQTMRQSIVRDGRSASYADQVLGTARRLLETCQHLGLVGLEVLPAVRRIKPLRHKRKPKGRYVERSDVLQLLAACMADPEQIRGARDAAAVALLYGAGLRRAEAAAVRWEDLDLEDGDQGLVHVKRGKGDRDRLVPMLPGLAPILDHWARVLRAEGRQLVGPVLLGLEVWGALRDEGISGHGVAGALDRARSRANVMQLLPKAWQALEAERRDWVMVACPAACGPFASARARLRQGALQWDCPACGAHDPSGRPDGPPADDARWAELAGRRILKPIRTHDLRRSFATWMLEQGLPESYVARLMGHASVDTTRVYNVREERQAVEAVRGLPVLEVEVPMLI